MTRPYEHYSEDELALLCDLRHARVPYAIISERMGRSVANLRTTYHNVKHGFRKGQPGYLRARRERMIRLHQLGLEVFEIARVYQTTSTNVMNVMAYAGYDAEMRQESRLDRDLRALIRGMPVNDNEPPDEVRRLQLLRHPGARFPIGA